METVQHLSFFKTCLSSIIMGLIAYNASFSVVPITYTIVAMICGAQSTITIFSTGVSQMVAGYLHTHASRAGIAMSTCIFGGFYIAEPSLRNRRHYNEKRSSALRRYFIENLANALVLNFMWETFTIFYIIQTEFIMYYIESPKIPNIWKDQRQLILIHGFTRYLAGCLSGASTGLINQLWQRYLAHKTNAQALFNTDRSRLKLNYADTTKVLSVKNSENWIKAFVMLSGALFYIFCNIPNVTGLHLLNLRKKKLISDILVINGGWLFLRDSAMIVIKKAEKPPITLPSAGDIEENANILTSEA